jgi:hypothetical protein
MTEINALDLQDRVNASLSIARDYIEVICLDGECRQSIEKEKQEFRELWVESYVQHSSELLASFAEKNSVP